MFKPSHTKTAAGAGRRLTLKFANISSAFWIFSEGCQNSLSVFPLVSFTLASGERVCETCIIFLHMIILREKTSLTPRNYIKWLVVSCEIWGGLVGKFGVS